MNSNTTRWIFSALLLTASACAGASNNTPGSTQPPANTANSATPPASSDVAYLRGEGDRELNLQRTVLIAGTAQPTAVRRVRATVREHLNEVLRCYDLMSTQTTATGDGGTSSDAGATGNVYGRGRVELLFNIAADGTTSDFRIGGNELRAEVGQCIIAAARAWQFPAINEALRVAYPFYFQTPTM